MRLHVNPALEGCNFFLLYGSGIITSLLKATVGARNQDYMESSFYKLRSMEKLRSSTIYSRSLLQDLSLTSPQEYKGMKCNAAELAALYANYEIMSVLTSFGLETTPRFVQEILLNDEVLQLLVDDGDTKKVQILLSCCIPIFSPRLISESKFYGS